MSNERPSLLTTGSTVSAAENIVAWLKPELLNEPQQNQPDRVSVIERHIGLFSTPAEVKTYLTDRDGCIRLAALRVRNVHSQAGGTVGDVTWAAYIMATDAWGYTRDTRCEVLVGKLVRRIVQRGAANGMKAERLATSVSADNIYSGGLNDLGLTMWAVTWEQEFRLDDEIDLATLPDFLRLGATLQVSDDTDPIKGVINVREP
ncbi:hypothetical protein [Klebsiella pneumoniae]|uniref:hypothetical protein n=1 Tax=Klebsiella pneumoniae TaxID=573 RepID=UPI0011577BAF|nr:hypothetical protein [Klebsiella pneumoniae]